MEEKGVEEEEEEEEILVVSEKNKRKKEKVTRLKRMNKYEIRKLVK